MTTSKARQDRLATKKLIESLRNTLENLGDKEAMILFRGRFLQLSEMIADADAKALAELAKQLQLVLIGDQSQLDLIQWPPREPQHSPEWDARMSLWGSSELPESENESELSSSELSNWFG